MIEQVAKAIHARNDHGSTWSDLDIYSKNEYREDARAAIEAMREPSQGVLDCRPPFMSVSDAKAMWRTMIDVVKDEQ